MPDSYAATVIRVHDGDTITAAVTVPGNPWFPTAIIPEAEIRLAGCNARELGQPGGDEARDHLAGILPAGTAIVLTPSKRSDKYHERVDAAVTMPDGTDLVTRLIADEWLAPWDGQGPKPVPPWPRKPAGGAL